MEVKDPKSTATSATDAGSESLDPKSDATSSETLSEVEEAEEVSDTSDESNSPAPSPDGAFDEQGKTGGLEETGPM